MVVNVLFAFGTLILLLYLFVSRVSGIEVLGEDVRFWCVAVWGMCDSIACYYAG